MGRSREIANTVLKKHIGESKELSKEQGKAISGILEERKDVLLILPTGSGKSIPFQILPETVRELRKEQGLKVSFPSEPIVILICPLVSLMKAHQKELNRMGVPNIILGDDIDGTVQGRYDIVMGSPESWVGNDTWKRMLLSDIYQTRVVAWVADEVHCVPKWGIDKSAGEKVFREAFGRLGELRSVLPPVPLLALTATATKATTKAVVKSLVMKAPIIIQRIPDRSNVMLTAQKVSTDPEVTFRPVMDELRKKGQAMDKTIVFCKTVKECAVLYDLFHTALGDHAYIDPSAPQTSDNRFIAMYHRATPDSNKTTVLDSLLHENSGHVRVVFATTALGMGVNIPDVRTIINYGPSSDVESYLQESGRAGRDSQPANAILLYHSYHLAMSDKDMKAYITSKDKCRRQSLLGHFSGDFVTPDSHNCCDICYSKCDCGLCPEVHVPYDFRRTLEVLPYCGVTRALSWDDKDDIVDGMKELAEMYAAELHCLYLPADSVTGVTDGLIKEVLEHAENIFTVEYVCEHLPVPNVRTAQDIVELMSELFHDFDYVSDSFNYADFTDDCDLDMYFVDLAWLSDDESDTGDD